MDLPTLTNGGGLVMALLVIVPLLVWRAQRMVDDQRKDEEQEG